MEYEDYINTCNKHRNSFGLSDFIVGTDDPNCDQLICNTECPLKIELQKEIFSLTQKGELL